MAKTPRLLSTTQTTPAGVVLHFSGNVASIPSGYLACDGSEVSKTSFASLYAVIGDAYNTQVDPTTGSNWAAPASGNFRLPDYRGLFLRGAGTSSGSDTTSVGGFQDHKTAKNGLNVSSASSSVTGTVGATGLSNSDGAHSHTVTDPKHSHSTQINLSGNTLNWSGTTATGWAAAQSFANGGQGSNSVATGISVDTTNSHTHSFSLTAPAQTVTTTGDNETRPKNKGVHYIIKF